MKIGLIQPQLSSARSRSARSWQHLVVRLAERGHETELVGIDQNEDNLQSLLHSYQRANDHDVSAFDLVISGSAPAWMVQHDNHLIYLTHRRQGIYRGYPETLGSLDDTEQGRRVRQELAPHATSSSSLLTAATALLESLDPDDPIVALPGPLARWLIRTLDDQAFAADGVRFIATHTEDVACRTEEVPQHRTVMVARPETASPLQVSTPPARSVFVTTRDVEPASQLDLVISAFAGFEDPSAVLRIGGNGPLSEGAATAAAADPRIETSDGPGDEALTDTFASTTAAIVAPGSNDLGLFALEAMRAGTPVITTSESGGAKELIEHGISGMVVEPTAERLTWAMRHVADNPRVQWELGLNARRSAAPTDWTALLDEIEELASPIERPRVLVLSTYPIEPMVGGGQRRVRHLLRALARWADITLVTSTPGLDGVRRRRIEPGIDQVVVGRSAAQSQAEEDLYFALGHVPADDVIAARLAEATPAFIREIAEQLEQVDAVVCAQPFLAPLVGDVRIPVVHDSQNVEAQLKGRLFADHGELGQWLTNEVNVVEADATRNADLLVACTQSDLDELLDAADRPELATMVVDNGVSTRSLPMRRAEHVAPARAEVLAAIDRPDTEDRPLGLFIGSWHPPNVEAARLMFDVARLRPDWIFVLAGSHTSEFAGEDLPPNVSLIAIFAEPLLWPLMASADVAMNPMASGGGSNLKVYDYLSVGVPVLTTDIGARGLASAHDLVTRVEPTPEALAEALDSVRALGQSSVGADMLARGRSTVEEKFDWTLLGERWATAVLGLIDAPRPRERFVTQHTGSPTLADTSPPPSDPVEATMEILGAAARSGQPSAVDVTMDPTVREHLKFASENRFVGQKLPERTRMKAAKQLLVRVGKALSNEQVNYNEALLDATEQMATQLHRNETEIRALRAEIATLRATNIERTDQE